MGLDNGLQGLRAFDHPSVKNWWHWLLEEYRPRYPVALVTPCSNVKPYTRSPTSRKIRGILRRLGLWSDESDEPRGLEWLYFSDLLVLVPYQRVEEYPACCYEVPPDLVLSTPWARQLVVDLLRRFMESGHGPRKLLVFLPRKHLTIWDEAKRGASRWPVEMRAKYTIFVGNGFSEYVKSLLRPS